MPRGASPKREKALQELEQQLKQQGRYPGREHEMALRMVAQQCAERGDGPEDMRGNDAADSTITAAAPSDRRVGRRGTGHMRRNTVRRARSS